MIDHFGRSIHYMRISVTDRCNLRCVYCMPPEGVPWISMQEILTYEEIVQVVKVATRMGIRQVRLTGGEPLVRKGLPDLVRALAGLEGIDEISLTTNGMLLEKLAQPLAEAGLKRVNISLDTLQGDKFKLITRGGEIERVWRGVAAAEAAGLSPIKINTVVVGGVNDDELASLAGLSVEHAWHIRFIELMPFADQQVWDAIFPVRQDRYVSVQEMVRRLDGLGLEPVAGPQGNGPARTNQIPGAQGTVGFIAPLGEHFCAACNRIRLTADGKLRPCLFSNAEVDVKTPLRQGENLDEVFKQVFDLKPERHELGKEISLSAWQSDEQLSRTMSQIGG